MLDCIIAGGTVVDGSGRPGVKADLGIRDGRIVAIGKIDESARNHIDADGLIVAPGFIDLHTHYDAQVFWDPSLSPSALHGVTTVIGGNCGFTIAPIAPEHGDYMMRLLACVEGMPLESLQTGVPWGSWTGFGGYLGQIDGKLAVNAGFLAGHSALRRLAMGADCHREVPSDAQLTHMESMLADALKEGALGFSSSNGVSHVDGDGNPVPSRLARDEEFVRLAAVVSGQAGTTLEYIPASVTKEAGRMTAMSVAGQRPLNWNVLVIASDRVEAVKDSLAVSDYAAARRGEIVALANPAPLIARRSVLTGFGLNTLPDWGGVLFLPVKERIAALCQPAVRKKLREGAARAAANQARLIGFRDWKVESVVSENNRDCVGKTVGEIAQARGAEVLDTLFDIAVADELRTSFAPPELGGDEASWRYRAEIWNDRRVVLGASDAGAHLDTLSMFTYPTDLLGGAVRERQLLNLEQAVHLLTERPARLYGLTGRGRLALGAHADIVVFDPATIASAPVTTRLDLPANGARLFAGAQGIKNVLVGGVGIVESGRYTGSSPGTVLRSGRDTATVLPGTRFN